MNPSWPGDREEEDCNEWVPTESCSHVEEAKLLWKLPSSLPWLWPLLAQSHPQWPSMGMPEEEVGWGCQQHSTARTLADARNKSIAKTRRGEGLQGEEGRRGRDYGLEWEKLEIVQQVQKVKADKWRERSRGAILVGWTPVLFPWSVQTQNHTSSCSHTVLPSSYIRHIPLLLTQGSQRKLEGHDEIGVRVNLKGSDQGH